MDPRPAPAARAAGSVGRPQVTADHARDLPGSGVSLPFRQRPSAHSMPRTRSAEPAPRRRPRVAWTTFASGLLAKVSRARHGGGMGALKLGEYLREQRRSAQLSLRQLAEAA